MNWPEDKAKTQYGSTVDNELTVLWEMHMQTEGSLTGRKCVAGCTTSTQCSVYIYIDLASGVSGSNRHYVDTDELIDQVVGADEDTAILWKMTMNLEMAQSLPENIYCEYKERMHAVVHLLQ